MRSQGKIPRLGKAIKTVIRRVSCAFRKMGEAADHDPTAVGKIPKSISGSLIFRILDYKNSKKLPWPDKH